MHEGTSPRLWVELDDLIRYFDTAVTPTGVGRVQLEVIPKLLAAYPELRKAFQGVWVFAETSGQNPYATEEAMGEIH